MSKQKIVHPLIALWFVVTISAMGVLMRYGLTPGTSARPVHASYAPMAPADQATLLMFVHPKCPCSSASVAELAQLMAHCAGRVHATVLFYRPPDQPDSWCHSSTWKSASEIPGVSVAVDVDARRARAHNAQTSGQVLLYNSAGHLRFEGGITASRGHEGDNDALDAVIQLINENKADTTIVHHPVFGCAIYPVSSSSN